MDNCVREEVNENKFLDHESNLVAVSSYVVLLCDIFNYLKYLVSGCSFTCQCRRKPPDVHYTNKLQSTEVNISAAQETLYKDDDFQVV